MKITLIPFMILSGIGLVLSVIVHVSALLDIPSPLGNAAWSLHIGIFVVWFPAVIVSQRMTRDCKQKDFWEVVLRACPKWMNHMNNVFFFYAVVNFIIFFVVMLIRNSEISSSDGETPSTVLWGFSGHWMAFYSAAFAILYSAIQMKGNDDSRH